MSITVTNAAALGPFLGRLKAAARSRLTGADAPVVPIVVLSDSKACSIPIHDPMKGTHTRFNTWAGRIIDVLKAYAGDAGTLFPAEQDEERHFGAAYNVYGDNSPNHRVTFRRAGYVFSINKGKSLWGNRGEDSSSRDLSGSDLPWVGISGYNVAIGDFRLITERFPHPFRYIDAIYPKVVAGTLVDGGDATAAVRFAIDGVNTDITTLAVAASCNNVQTIDASYYGYHGITLVTASAAAYALCEGFAIRSGYPGVLDWNCSRSGSKFGYLTTNFTTAAKRRDYLGLNALTSLGFGNGLVIMEFGFNDASGSYSAQNKADIKTGLINFCDAVPDGYCILIVLHPQVAANTDTRTFWDGVINDATTGVLAAATNPGRIAVADCFQPNASWSGSGGWPTGGTSPRVNAVSAGYLWSTSQIVPWQANRWYQPYEVVRQVNTGTPCSYFECKTAGYSGTAEPTWDETVGLDTDEAVLGTAGTVVWTCLGADQQDTTHPNERGHLEGWAQPLMTALGWDWMRTSPQMRARRLVP